MAYGARREFAFPGVEAEQVISASPVSGERQWLIGDFVNLARLGVLERRSKPGNVRKQVHQAICFHSQDDYSQRSVVDTLLFGETFVNSNEDVEAVSHRIKERPVIEISPAHLLCRSNLVRR